MRFQRRSAVLRTEPLRVSSLSRGCRYREARVTNPYRIDGPALISFSGGRTSGYMLWHILDAYDGKLPDDVYVCFANTGKEREETLRFINDCGQRWGIPIFWLQWRSRLKRTPVIDRFEQVSYHSAARQGEPFKALVTSKQDTPKAIRRWCTEHLKVQVLSDFMETLGYARWNNVIGLRADEVRRAARQLRKNDEGEVPWTSVMPMLKAGVTSRDVWKWWLGDNADPKNLTSPLPRGFDLGIYPYEGNCDGCFLKGTRLLEWMEREKPGMLDWWADMEVIGKGTFDKEWSYRDLQSNVARQPLLVPLDWRETEFDAECGVGGTDTNIKCGRRAA